jgi:hypothetical protein
LERLEKTEKLAAIALRFFAKMQGSNNKQKYYVTHRQKI